MATLASNSLTSNLRSAAAASRGPTQILNAALLAVAWFAIASAGHAMSPGDERYGFFWLPSGLLLATLLLSSRSEWPALLMGALIGDVGFGLAHNLAPMAIATRFGFTAFEAVAGAFGVEQLIERPFRLTTVRQLMWFLFIAATLATLAGSLLAAATLDGFRSTQEFMQALWPRWGSSAVGVLILAPYILAWADPAGPPSALRLRARQLEAALLFALTVVWAFVVFLYAQDLLSPLRILLAAPLAWAGLRFGLRGVTTAHLALALPIALLAGAQTTGLSVQEMLTTQIGPAQVMISSLVVCGLALAMTLEESQGQIDALRRGEDRFRAIVEDQSEMIMRWKPDGTRTFVNQAYCRIAGETDATLVGASFFTLLTEADRARLTAKILALTPEQPLAVDLDRSMRRPDDPRWQEWTHRGIFDADGRLVELQSTGRDITEKLSDEREIRRLSRLYASLSAVNHAVLTEATPESFLASTCRSLVTDGGMLLAMVGRANREAGVVEPVARAGTAGGFLETISLRLDESPEGNGPTATCIREQRPYVCNDVDREPRIVQWLEKARDFGIHSSAAFPLRDSSGVWGALSVHAGHTDHFGDREVRLLEEIASNVCFALDNFAQVDSRRATERALSGSEERFRLAMEYSPIGVALVDTDGRWIEVNPALCRIVGYSRDELLRIDFQTITHPDDLDADLALMQQVLAGRLDSYGMEKRYIRKSGETIWIQLDVVLVRPPDGAPRYFLSKIQDITERRDAQNRVLELNATLEQRVVERTRELEQANRQLVLANRELDAFSSAVSHELRAPLRLIDGFTQMLARGHIDPLDAVGTQDLSRIRDAARQMSERIDGMLRMARVTREPLRRSQVDISAIARETIDALTAAHPEHVVRVSTQPGLVANGSATLLRAVMENLLGNAWKFTSRAAEASIEFGCCNRGGELMYFVRDNGVGFDTKYVDQLFQAFHRLHDESDFPGTGIGLVTVQRILQRHGGRIEVESAVGQGATFYFTIPDGEGEARAVEA